MKQSCQNLNWNLIKPHDQIWVVINVLNDTKGKQSFKSTNAEKNDRASYKVSSVK